MSGSIPATSGAEVPPPRSETVLIEWTAVEGPRRCLTCGHDHWGWMATRSSHLLWASPRLAPQWGYCSPACDCTTLVLADLPERAEPTLSSVVPVPRVSGPVAGGDGRG